MNAIRPARIIARSFCVLAMIATGGCSDLFASHPVEVAPPAPPPKPPPVSAGPRVPDVEAGVKTPRAAAKRPSAAPQTAAVPGPADLAPAPVKLIGLTEPETVALLGPPSAQWDRPPAKVWHYQGPDCAVDVFFYLDVSRNQFAALRATAVGPDGAAPPTTDLHCLNRIRDVAQRK
jgi:hypothetical protein